MASPLLFDLSRVFLFTKDRNYKGELNTLHKTLSSQPGYKFFEYFSFNDELIDIANKLKLKTELFMFTSGTIQEAPEAQMRLGGLFREIFSAEKLGLSKSNPLSYLDITNKIGRPQEDVIFIDDSSKNIIAAREASLKTILYTGNFQLINDLQKHIKFTI